MNIIEQGLAIQGAIVEANKLADKEQEERDRMRQKHGDHSRPLPTINGSREWYESGHGSGDFA